MIQTQTEPFYLDCRPSDGMILATLLATPIYMSPEVIEAAGRVLDINDQRSESEGEPALDGVLESLEEPDADPEAVHSALEDSEGVKDVANFEINESKEESALSAEELVDPETGQLMSELEQLKAHLDWLIAQEAYEQAAEVRDQISKLEEGI